MVTIGNDTLPGLITTIESADSTGANLAAPGVPVLLGQAYLSSGSASADTAKRVTRPKQARDLFGPADKSLLTQAIQDALVEGAYPVYAIAPAETAVTGEDLSGKTGQTGTLANAPVLESAADITFTINSTDKSTVLYYKGDPANGTPGTDEVLLNPQTGKYHIDESQGNTGDNVDYTYVDYANTFDEVTNAQFSDQYLRDIVDFVAPIDENNSVVSSAESKVNSMESNGWLAIAVGGAGEPYVVDQETTTDDTGNYSDNYDNSRAQLLAPSRKAGGETLMGGYIGRRAAIGIDAIPMFSTVQTAPSLLVNLNRSQMEDLVNADVIPIKERSQGARIEEDLTTVSASNTSESAWQRGFARLVTDFVAERIGEESEPYIGEFNNEPVQHAIEGRVSQQLQKLLKNNQLEAFSLLVQETDATTITVDVGINTADPLRNIKITVSAGDVENGVQVEG